METLQTSIDVIEISEHYARFTETVFPKNPPLPETAQPAKLPLPSPALLGIYTLGA